MTDLETNYYPNVGQSFEIAGIILVMMLLTNPLNFIFSKFINKEVMTLICYLFSIGIPFWIVYLIRKIKTNTKAFNFAIENRWIIPFVIIASSALLFGVIEPICSLIPIPEFFKKMLIEQANQKGFFFFLCVVVAAPILEELIFRGIMLDGLLKKYSPVKSILISSFLFGFVHLNPLQFVAGLFFGVFIGWSYYKTKSLSLTIIIHATVNLVGFLMRYFDNFEPLSLVERYGGTLNLVLVIVGCTLIFAISTYYLNRVFAENSVIWYKKGKCCAKENGHIFSKE